MSGSDSVACYVVVSFAVDVTCCCADVGLTAVTCLLV